MNTRDVLTVRGYVQSLPKASGRDDAARVAVVTDDGTEYRILHKGAGVGLAGNINANVEVTGCVIPGAEPAANAIETEEPVCSLAVKGYRLNDGFDDPWYDDTVS